MKIVIYTFKNTWHIKAPNEQCIAALLDYATWPTWWSGLQRIAVLRHQPEVLGDRFFATWGYALSYKLRTTITVTGYIPTQQIKCSIKGDLLGNGSWNFTETNGETDVQVAWNVSTTKHWMNILAPVLKPVFRYGHMLIMRRGEAGLNKYLSP